jgi:hypothetical protein
MGGYLLWEKFKPRKKHTPEEAIRNAKNIVSKGLKSPGTAVFSNTYVGKQDDTTFIVAGDVDATNSFGAYGRLYYSCVIVFLPNDLINAPHIMLENKQ